MGRTLDEYVTADEACRRLGGLSRTGLWRLLKRRPVRRYPVSKRKILYRSCDIQSLLDELSVAP